MLRTFTCAPYVLIMEYQNFRVLIDACYIIRVTYYHHHRASFLGLCFEFFVFRSLDLLHLYSTTPSCTSCTSLDS